MKRILFLSKISALLITSCNFLFAQTVTVPFTHDKWDFQNAETSLENYLGKESILIKNGDIYTREDQMENGTIEFDINFPDQRGFPGIAFRVQDPDNYEDFYFRPHKSGKPDALQYTPVFNTSSAWQLYNGKGYTDTLTMTPDVWHHVKIVLESNKANIFYDDLGQPILKITDLKRKSMPGKFGLMSLMAPVHFANFSYKVSKETSQSSEEQNKEKNDGTINTWYVSNAFGKELFYDKTDIDEATKKLLTWTKMTSEPSGIVNLARYAKYDMKNGKITTIARCEVISDSEVLKLFKFGFSDEVRLYFNNKLVYTGSDAFLSRDYQFSGVMGYYDGVFLPLKKGKNEIWMVVTDYFGGWGVQGKLTDAVVKEVNLDPSVLEKYVGDYSLNPDFSLVVTFEDGNLMVQPTGQQKFRMYARSPEHFFLKIVDVEFDFLKDNSGRVDRLVVHQNGQVVEAKRKE